MNRVREGYCCVVNPFNPSQVTRVSLSPGDVDAIVFWTRNSEPLISYLPELDDRGYRYYFQYTLTGYPRILEPHAPRLDEAIRAFRRLADVMGPERVIWRYDPIVLTNLTTLEYHARNFERLCIALDGYTRRVVISLMDEYRSVMLRLERMSAEGLKYIPNPENQPGFAEMVCRMVDVARAHGIETVSCAEDVHLTPYGVRSGKCIDDELIRRLFGIEVTGEKDPGQRATCRCVVSKDIGAYDTCRHGCAYCYATGSGTRAFEHDPTSPSLIGRYEC